MAKMETRTQMVIAVCFRYSHVKTYVYQDVLLMDSAAHCKGFKLGACFFVCSSRSRAAPGRLSSRAQTLMVMTHNHRQDQAPERLAVARRELRGPSGLEVTLLLLCYKVIRKDAFFLLRGNHECAAINRIYGFYDEWETV